MIQREPLRELNLGDKVYLASFQYTRVKKTCPICLGKLSVIVILGNGDQVESECVYCESGFEVRGYIQEYEYVPDVRQIEITGKDVHEDSEGKRIEYRHNTYSLYLGESIFLTEEEAVARVEELIRNKEEEDLKRRELAKDGRLKSLSQNIGYYQKKKREALKEIEWADKKIKYFKELKKGGEE